MYAKVFSQIYDGTLCTKGPWEALVTFQQLLVLADMEGNVDMTQSAISRRTTIPLEIIQRGIAELVKPDPDSRTPAEEGRRLIPLAEGRTWGWRIVNYVHYRELKREEDRREYHRQYWHKRKASNSTDSTDSTATQHTQPNQPKQKQKQIQKQKQEIPHTPATTPTAAGRVCGLMRKSGLSDANPGHPTLLALLAAGTTDEEFQHATAEAVNRGKGFAYAIGMLTKQRDAAAALSLQTGPMPARETPWAREARERVHAMTGGLVSAKPPGTTKETLDGTELVNRVA